MDFFFSSPFGSMLPFLLFLLVCSFLLTRYYVTYARQKGFFDIPNDRSSHQVPTPRGGGVGFVALFLMGVLCFFFIYPAERPLWLALGGGGIIVASVGWLDDRWNLPARWRLSAHFLAVAFALACLGGYPSLTWGTWTIPLRFWGTPLALVGGVWLINLFNFMDGVDGLAASEAVLVSLGAALVVLKNKSCVPLAFILLVLSAVVLGFLLLNWHPAKVFMGDVASGFLGYVFVVFVVFSEQVNVLPFSSWLLLLSLFVADATFTLVSRMLRREILFHAHREHAYQVMVRSGKSHAVVTSAFVFMNVFLLVLVALLDGKGVLSILPIFWFCVLFSIWFMVRKSDQRLLKKPER